MSNTFSRALKGSFVEFGWIAVLAHCLTVVFTAATIIAIIRQLGGVDNERAIAIFATCAMSAMLVSAAALIRGQSHKPHVAKHVPRPQLTDEQICYEIVKKLIRDLRFKERCGISFDGIHEFLLAQHWRFSAGSTTDVLHDFGERTGLLQVDYDQQKIYPTQLAANPDDRTLANMMIADFEQMPDRDNKDIWIGCDNISVNDLIEDLRQLTPRGLDHVRLYRAAEERVAAIKAS